MVQDFLLSYLAYATLMRKYFLIQLQNLSDENLMIVGNGICLLQHIFFSRASALTDLLTADLMLPLHAITSLQDFSNTVDYYFCDFSDLDL